MYYIWQRDNRPGRGRQKTISLIKLLKLKSVKRWTNYRLNEKSQIEKIRGKKNLQKISYRFVYRIRRIFCFFVRPITVLETNAR